MAAIIIYQVATGITATYKKYMESWVSNRRIWLVWGNQWKFLQESGDLAGVWSNEQSLPRWQGKRRTFHGVNPGMEIE